ncbi:Fen1-like nuclease [Carp edema virus]|nr:Fen1-like nuclease [Carp edema virus]
MGIKDLTKVLLASGELESVKGNGVKFDIIIIDFSTILYRFIHTSNNKDELYERIIKYFMSFSKKKTFVFLDSGYIKLKENIRNKRAKVIEGHQTSNFKNYITAKFVLQTLVEIKKIFNKLLDSDPNITEEEIDMIIPYFEQAINAINDGDFIDVESKVDVSNLVDSKKILDSDSDAFDFKSYFKSILGNFKDGKEKAVDAVTNSKVNIKELYSKGGSGSESEKDFTSESETESNSSEEEDAEYEFKVNKKRPKINTDAELEKRIVKNNPEFKDFIDNYAKSLTEVNIDMVTKEEVDKEEIDETLDLNSKIIVEVDKMVVHDFKDCNFEELKNKISKKYGLDSYISIDNTVSALNLYELRYTLKVIEIIELIANEIISRQKLEKEILENLTIENVDSIKSEENTETDEIKELNSVREIVKTSKYKTNMIKFLNTPEKLFRKCYYNLNRSIKIIREDLNTIAFKFVTLSHKLKKIISNELVDILTNKFDNLRFFKSDAIDAEFHACQFIDTYYANHPGNIKVISTDQDVLLFLSNLKTIKEVYIENKKEIYKLNCNKRSGTIAKLVLLFNGGDFNMGILRKKIPKFDAIDSRMLFDLTGTTISFEQLSYLIRKEPTGERVKSKKVNELITTLNFVEKYAGLDLSCYNDEAICDVELDWATTEKAIVKMLRYQTEFLDIEFYIGNCVYYERMAGAVIFYLTNEKDQELLESDASSNFSKGKWLKKIIKIVRNHKIVDCEIREAKVYVTPMLEIFVKKGNFILSKTENFINNFQENYTGFKLIE